MMGQNQGKQNPPVEGFVPATQWNEMRQKFVPEPSQTRGLRSLTAALESENPEMSDRSLVPIRRSNRARVAWQPETTALQPDDFVLSLAEMEAAGVGSAESDVDSCFGSHQFMDHLEWTLQTIDLQTEADRDDTMDLDLELGLMEAVQDLSRIVARGTARRTERSVTD